MRVKREKKEKRVTKSSQHRTPPENRGRSRSCRGGRGRSRGKQNGRDLDSCTNNRPALQKLGYPSRVHLYYLISFDNDYQCFFRPKRSRLWAVRLDNHCATDLNTTPKHSRAYRTARRRWGDRSGRRWFSLGIFSPFLVDRPLNYRNSPVLP